MAGYLAYGVEIGCWQRHAWETCKRSDCPLATVRIKMYPFANRAWHGSKRLCCEICLSLQKGLSKCGEAPGHLKLLP
jgi:hypothetical protein